MKEFNFNKIIKIEGLKKTIPDKWNILEETYLPCTFISEDGYILYKFLENSETFIDTWLLFKINDISIFDKMEEDDSIPQEIAMKMLDQIDESAPMAILEWDLISFNVSFKEEISKDKIIKIFNEIYNSPC